MDKKDDQGKSMSQKDLATKINEKPSVVRSSFFCFCLLATYTLILTFLSLLTFSPTFLSSHSPPPLHPPQIADYEAGRAIPNVALLAKIERIIGVKLRGDAKLIGTPLPAPGSKKK